MTDADLNPTDKQEGQAAGTPPAGSFASGSDSLLAAARKEAADNYERYLRTAADLENFRKRSIREREELRTATATRILEDFLPVLDNLGLGQAAARQPNADLKTLTSGVDMVLQQLRGLAGKHGLVEINPMGEAFDPHRHEAIAHQPSAEIGAEHVLSVVRSGYLLNGRLLRPASVVVSSGAQAPETVI